MPMTPPPNDRETLHNTEIYQNRIKLAVKRLESTENGRVSMANKILAMQREASEENDRVHQYFSRIPNLSPREVKTINNILDTTKHQRQRYLGRIEERRFKQFEAYQVKHKATRHANKDAVNKRGLGRSDESLRELRQTKNILQSGPRPLKI
jgi:transketolase